MTVSEKIMGAECRFAVLETDDPLAGYIDKLDEWFAGKQQSG